MAVVPDMDATTTGPVYAAMEEDELAYLILPRRFLEGSERTGGGGWTTRTRLFAALKVSEVVPRGRVGGGRGVAEQRDVDQSEPDVAER